MPDRTLKLDPFDLPNAFGTITRPDFGFVGSEEELEHEVMPPDNLSYSRRNAKIETLNALKRKFAIEHLRELPKPSVSVHIVTNARFDFWDFVPALLKLTAPRIALEWYGSTWILNRRNATELLALYDEGKIRSIGMLTGIYFKRRETAVFATLYEGLKTRGQRFKACLNHSKWFAMRLDDETGITVEGSANFTENGNIETFVLTNDRGLFDFHKSWADTLLEPCA